MFLPRLSQADIPRTLSGKISELAVRDTVHGRAVTNHDALAILRRWRYLKKYRR